MNKNPAELLNIELAAAVATLTAESVEPYTDTDRGWRAVTNKAKSIDRGNYANWTDADLTTVRDLSRDLLGRNKFAIGAAKNRVNYCVDLGFRYKVEPMPGVDKKEATTLLTAAQEFVDAFVELNTLSEVEAEALQRADRDGEFLLRLFDGDIPQVRFVEPEVLATPDSERLTEPRGGEAVTLGIQHKDTDRATVTGYWIDGENVNPEEIVHGRFNADSSFVRGIPLFDPIDADLRDAADLYRSMSSMTKARAKIAMLWKLKQIGAQAEANLAKRILEGTQTNERGETSRVNLENMPFGTVLRYSGVNTESIEFPNLNAGASDGVAVLKAGLDACGAAVNMPPWMFCGTADEKYANAFVGEAPALKSFRRVQRQLCQSFGEGRLGSKASLVWRAIRLAVAAGRLSADTLTAVRITCTPPSLEVRDKAVEASESERYNAIGVKSVETIQESLGLDPAKEAERIKAERAAGLSAAFAYKATQAAVGALGAIGGALPPNGPAAQ